MKRILMLTVFMISANSVVAQDDFFDNLNKNRIVSGVKATGYGLATYIAARHGFDTLNAFVHRDEKSSSGKVELVNTLAKAGVISLGMGYVSYLALRRGIRNATHALNIKS